MLRDPPQPLGLCVTEDQRTSNRLRNRSGRCPWRQFGAPAQGGPRGRSMHRACTRSARTSPDAASRLCRHWPCLSSSCFRPVPPMPRSCSPASRNTGPPPTGPRLRCAWSPRAPRAAAASERWSGPLAREGRRARAEPPVRTGPLAVPGHRERRESLAHPAQQARKERQAPKDSRGRPAAKVPQGRPEPQGRRAPKDPWA